MKNLVALFLVSLAASPAKAADPTSNPHAVRNLKPSQTVGWALQSGDASRETMELMQQLGSKRERIVELSQLMARQHDNVMRAPSLTMLTHAAMEGDHHVLDALRAQHPARLLTDNARELRQEISNVRRIRADLRALGVHHRAYGGPSLSGVSLTPQDLKRIDKPVTRDVRTAVRLARGLPAKANEIRGLVGQDTRLHVAMAEASEGAALKALRADKGKVTRAIKALIGAHGGFKPTLGVLALGAAGLTAAAMYSATGETEPALAAAHDGGFRVFKLGELETQHEESASPSASSKSGTGI